ncbi:hypothetical protein RND71_022892 [Anisodus tanguticus]|uniref:Uncharacterized protein n=1 Tax=Anisodus tanguticus TaxID=243964 RepID=A0AAE1RTS1_9SOLA|nr:hypothetical protein RND71_022892 [Anisodus tanguticus]
MSGRGSLLDAVQLAETLGTTGVRSPQVSVLWGGGVKHLRQGSREISLLHSSSRSKVSSDVQQVVARSGTHAPTLSLYTPAGQKSTGEGGGHWARSISSEFLIQIEAHIKKILRRLRDRGLISRRRPCATIKAYNFSGVKKDIESKADMLTHWLDRADLTEDNDVLKEEQEGLVQRMEDNQAKLACRGRTVPTPIANVDEVDASIYDNDITLQPIRLTALIHMKLYMSLEFMKDPTLIGTKLFGEL